MKSSEKERVMNDFLSQKTQVLVSTSVIEVGVDVPNASVMLIEGAEHFGLAQLHQFRGRVGRSFHQSYCFLMSESANEASLARLETFTQTEDGFALAELDLKTRGFGNLFGPEQTGYHYFNYFNPHKHKDLASLARSEAKRTIEEDPELEELPFFQERIRGAVLHFE